MEIPDDIPEDFLCPITQELMENPVIAADGHSYEQEAIEKWFNIGHKTSPSTGQKLKHTALTPNFALKKVINKFKENLPVVQREMQIRVDLEEAIKLREELLTYDLEKIEQQNLGFKKLLDAEKRKSQQLELELQESKKMWQQANELNIALNEKISYMTQHMQEMIMQLNKEKEEKERFIGKLSDEKTELIEELKKKEEVIEDLEKQSQGHEKPVLKSRRFAQVFKVSDNMWAT